MTVARFLTCLALVLGDEGGFNDDPEDNGGRTMRGVTQGTYDAWRQEQNLPLRNVRFIERTEIEAIYRSGYWEPIRGDDLPVGVDYCTFDASVNSGPRRAIHWLQQAVGATPDGILGPKTLAAVQAAGARGIVRDMCAIRLSYLRRLDDWPHFGRGWQRRVEEVERDALSLAPETAPVPPIKVHTIGDDNHLGGFWCWLRRLFR